MTASSAVKIFGCGEVAVGFCGEERDFGRYYERVAQYMGSWIAMRGIPLHPEDRAHAFAEQDVGEQDGQG